jgi:hypothetical protein
MQMGRLRQSVQMFHVGTKNYLPSGQRGELGDGFYGENFAEL